jgi:prepilin-type N-terminal cleavage/methylation domain-containing protein
MDNKGFTLIEMLLVVAIIGFLVAILLPSVGTFGADAKDKAVKADLRQLKAALEVYYISFGVYPPDTSWGDETSFLITADGTSGYQRLIDQFPADPYGKAAVANHTPSYNYDVDGDTFIITSDKPNPGDPGDCTAVDATDTGQTGGAALYITNAANVASP